MPAIDSEPVSKDDIKQWLNAFVAPEVQELQDSEIEAPHTSTANRGVLAWVAKYYIEGDPESLYFPDGPSDGGFDIVSIIDTENGLHVEIYQLSGPKPEALTSGQGRPIKTKFADDIRTVHRTITGKRKKLRELNPTAAEVMRQINRIRELVDDPADTTSSITIEIHPVSLKAAADEAYDLVADLSKAAESEWSRDGETWKVRKPLDIEALYRLYQKKRPREQSPDKIVLPIFGSVGIDHAQRGPYLCFVNGAALAAEYREWGAGLLDANLRYSLGKTDVNRRIEDELSRAASVKWFHEKNNGVVLTCNQCNAREDSIVLHDPQIVNGGQTIHSIAKVIEDLEVIPPEEKRLSYTFSGST